MTWKAQYPLADRWTLLVLDRRGFGESPPADTDDFEDDARDIAEALGDGAPSSLIRMAASVPSWPQRRVHTPFTLLRLLSRRRTRSLLIRSTSDGLWIR